MYSYLLYLAHSQIPKHWFCKIHSNSYHSGLWSTLGPISLTVILGYSSWCLVHFSKLVHIHPLLTPLSHIFLHHQMQTTEVSYCQPTLFWSSCYFNLFQFLLHKALLQLLSYCEGSLQAGLGSLEMFHYKEEAHDAWRGRLLTVSSCQKTIFQGNMLIWSAVWNMHKNAVKLPVCSTFSVKHTGKCWPICLVY